MRIILITLLLGISDLFAQQITDAAIEGRKFEKMILSLPKVAPPKALLDYQLMYIKDSCDRRSRYYSCTEAGYLNYRLWPYENPFAEKNPVCKVKVEYYGDRYKVVYTDDGTGGCDLTVAFYEIINSDVRKNLVAAYHSLNKEESEVAQEEQRCDSIIQSEWKSGNDNNLLALERDRWRELRLQIIKRKDSVYQLMAPYLWSEANDLWIRNTCTDKVNPDTGASYTFRYLYVLKDSGAVEQMRMFGDTTYAGIMPGGNEAYSWKIVQDEILTGGEDPSISVWIQSYKGGVVFITRNTVLSDDPENRATISEVFVLQRVK